VIQLTLAKAGKSKKLNMFFSVNRGGLLTFVISS